MKVKTALLALSVLAGSLARAQTPANGFYQIVESGGVAVKELRGGEIHLGEKLPKVVSSAVIFSVDNYNQQFYVSLPTPQLLSFNPSYSRGDSFVPSFPQIALYVDAFCLRVWGAGRVGTMLNIAYTSAVGAQAFG